MSVRLMTAVFEYDMPDLKTDDDRVSSDSACKFVLLALADTANDYGEGAYPGVRRLCKKTSLSTQTVCNALNALRHNEYTHLEGKSKLETNSYKINVNKLGFHSLESSDSNGKNESTTTNRGEVQKNVFTLYESNIGPLTPIIADQLKDAENTYVFSWIEEAITLSVTNNKRNWRYCETILKRWKESGKDDGKGKPEAKAQPEQKTELELFMEKHQ